MAVLPSCSESYLLDIPRLVNTSGILLVNHSSHQEKISLLRDYVNKSIHGKEYRNKLGLSCAKLITALVVVS